jgi:epoxyqueuosine reductase
LDTIYKKEYNMPKSEEIAARLLEISTTLGASVAGTAGVAMIREVALQYGHRIKADWLKEWLSVLVLGLVHPADKPDLDWWGTQYGTTGNYKLRLICNNIKETLAKELGIKSRLLNYQLGHMGIFLKDTAIIAGLGCMGDNNLLLTEQFGPRLRLLGLLLDIELPTAGASSWSPCKTCEHPCWKSCPRQAFASGAYDRTRCKMQMCEDERNRSMVDTEQWGRIALIKYCRACELACPVGG